MQKAEKGNNYCFQHINNSTRRMHFYQHALHLKSWFIIVLDFHMNAESYEVKMNFDWFVEIANT